VADVVEAVVRADGNATASRKSKEGPFARMMADVLEAIDGRKQETAAIAAYLAHPHEERRWAMNCAKLLFPPSRRIAGMQRAKK
jgi:hypothetical protein